MLARASRVVGRCIMTGIELESAEVDGQPIAFRQAGHGPALLLLHGFLGDSRCWMRQLAGLADRFRVVAWDAPGAGSSPDPPDEFTTAHYAHSLAAFLDALGIDRAHVVGLSWGGILAQEFYRHHPGRVRSLILADSYAGWRGSLPEHVWRDRLATCLRDADDPPEVLVARLLPGMFADAAPDALRADFSAIASELHPQGFRVMARSSAEVDTTDLLPRIDVPTLLLWGADDRRSPMQIATRMHAAIPGAELVVIPEAGHVSNMEQPDLFNAHVRRFCSAV